MASYANMALEDIIKQNKVKTKNKQPKEINNYAKPRNVFNKNVRKPEELVDARNKIIMKKRTQIVDAREKLAELAKQKDARLKLDRLRQNKISPSRYSARNINNRRNQEQLIRPFANKVGVFTDRTRQVNQGRLSKFKMQLQNKKNTKQFMPDHLITKRNRDFNPGLNLKPIVRTVPNDIAIIDEDDPMDIEYVPRSRADMNQRTMNFKIIAHNNDAFDKFTINRRTVPSEREKSPPRLHSILKKRPMASMRSDRKPDKIEPEPAEYRIIVSNLRTTVTAGDIQELFGDVGGMIESRLVRPGTAEVMYKSATDAQRAVDLYHNRQLDRQPMNCLLVTPRAPSSAALRTSSKPLLPPSTNSNVEPDLSTFHKVLFSHF